MISFNFEEVKEIDSPKQETLKNWLENVVLHEGFKIDWINYVFCNDAFLLDLNQKYLNHDTLTDVIGFNYNVGKKLQGDIFISIDRVADNAREFDVGFEEELSRVMVHGLLHFCGWTDASPEEKVAMRHQENFHLASRLIN